MDTQRYVVRQGDYLAKLAYQFGCEPSAIWDHPDNAELRALRGGEGELLYPGDLLVIPAAEPREVGVQSGTSNDYAADVPRVDVVVKLVFGADPFANEDFEVQGLGDCQKGTTDGEGKLTFKAPVSARTATIILTRLNWPLQVMIGDMDPLAEPLGVMKRLFQLGYLDELRSTDDVEYLAVGLKAFQSAHGLPETGELDEPTKSALQERYGC